MPAQLNVPNASSALLDSAAGRGDVVNRRVRSLRCAWATTRKQMMSRLFKVTLPPALTDIHGVMHHPFEDSDAIANVLVFTMQDCPIANSYIPTLNKLVEEYGPRGIRLLLVHVDPQLTMMRPVSTPRSIRSKLPVVIDRQHAWVNSPAQQDRQKLPFFRRQVKFFIPVGLTTSMRA